MGGARGRWTMTSATNVHRHQGKTKPYTVSRIKRLKRLGIVVELSDSAGAILQSPLKDGHEDGDQEELLAALDAVESVILGHACAGVDVESLAYQAGIEAALEAIANHLV